MWCGHLDFLSETTTVASGRMSVNPGYVQFDYIEVFYNRQRHQARLDHLRPPATKPANQAA